jgi:hypothetical protein
LVFVEIPPFHRTDDYAAVPGESVVHQIVQEIEEEDEVTYEVQFKDGHTEAVSAAAFYRMLSPLQNIFNWDNLCACLLQGK